MLTINVYYEVFTPVSQVFHIILRNINEKSKYLDSDFVDIEYHRQKRYRCENDYANSDYEDYHQKRLFSPGSFP